jgi:LysR family transcriptional regulator (chromosome initiation inhibitor)
LGRYDGVGRFLFSTWMAWALAASGALVDLTPDRFVDVALYWHAWRIQPPRLERMGAALVKGARAVLLPSP